MATKFIKRNNLNKIISRYKARPVYVDDDIEVLEDATIKRVPKPKVFVMGLAAHGALGQPDLLYQSNPRRKLKEYMHKPLKLGFGVLNKVKDIACGYDFTVFHANVDGTSAVYATGLNTDSQIGVFNSEKHGNIEIVISPQRINLPCKSEKLVVHSISAGRAHVGVVTNEGTFLWGNNSYGQCGRQIIKDEDYFRSQYINKIDLSNISQVYCGQDHTIFLTQTGTLYSCGWGADGQTGQGHFQKSCEPKLVIGDIDGEVITKVATKGDFCLALNEKGELFGWGNSEYNQFASVTDQQQLDTARHLNFLHIGKIIDIAASGTMCLILNEHNQIFVWGYGALGNGEEADFSKIPIELPATLFGKNEVSPEAKVVTVAAGLNHLCAINNYGSLFTWGKNTYGSLGIGNTINQYFPLRVSIPSLVRKVSCGVHHTVVLGLPII